MVRGLHPPPGPQGLLGLGAPKPRLLGLGAFSPGLVGLVLGRGLAGGWPNAWLTLWPVGATLWPPGALQPPGGAERGGRGGRLRRPGPPDTWFSLRTGRAGGRGALGGRCTRGADIPHYQPRLITSFYPLLITASLISIRCSSLHHSSEAPHPHHFLASANHFITTATNHFITWG